MSKKQRDWSSAQEVALIAWLDICIQTGQNFDDTIVAHLEKQQRTSADKGDPSNRLTIHEKLSELARLYNPQAPYRRIQELKRRGSICLTGLPTKIRRQVSLAFGRYKTTVALKSVSPHGQESSRPSLVPSQHSPEDGTTANTDFHAGDGDGGAFDDRSMAEHAQEVDTPLYGQRPRTAETNLSLCNGGSSSKGITLKTYPSFNDLVMSVRQRIGLPAHCVDAIESLHQQFESERDLANKTTQRLRKFWDIEIDKLESENNDLREKNAKLVAHNQLLQNARLNREKAGCDPLESDLFRQSAQIWELLQRVRKMEKGAEFLREIKAIPSEAQKPVLFWKAIDETMLEIESQLESLLHVYEQSMPTCTISLVAKSGLETLLRSAMSGCHMEQPESLDDNWRLVQWVSDNHPTLIIRALVLTALRDWVFYSEFFCCGFGEFGRLLLQEYRHIAKEFGGWRELRAYDKMAYKRIIESHQFEKHFLPREASQLARQLTEQLAPLFGFTSEDGDNTPRTTRNTPETAREEIQEKVYEIFHSALKLKADSLVTENLYEFCVFPLESSSTDHTACLASVRHGSTLVVSSDSWIHALLKVYPAIASESTSDFNEALVKVSNFGRYDTLNEDTICLHTASIRSLKPASFVRSDDPHLEEGPDHERAANASRSRDHPPALNTTNQSVQEPERNSSSSGRLSTASIAENWQGKDPNSTNACDLCDGVFSQRASLLRHKRTKACSLCRACGQRFRRRIDLDKHLPHCQPKQITTLEENSHSPSLSLDGLNAGNSKEGGSIASPINILDETGDQEQFGPLTSQYFVPQVSGAHHLTDREELSGANNDGRAVVEWHEPQGARNAGGKTTPETSLTAHVDAWVKNIHEGIPIHSLHYNSVRCSSQEELSERVDRTTTAKRNFVEEKQPRDDNHEEKVSKRRKRAPPELGFAPTFNMESGKAMPVAISVQAIPTLEKTAHPTPSEKVMESASLHMPDNESYAVQTAEPFVAKILDQLQIVKGPIHDPNRPPFVAPTRDFMSFNSNQKNLGSKVL